MRLPDPHTEQPRRRAVVLPFPRLQPLEKARELALWLDRAIFACLCVLALVTMESVFVARWTLYLAVLLWVVKWILGRPILKPQPLIRPLLLFLVLLGIATALSYAPLLSWLRMQWFTVLLLSVVVAQNVINMQQVKALLVLLLLGGAISAGLTGWQYLYGIGTELPVIARGSALFRDGLRSGDVVQLMNGHRTRSLGQWQRALAATENDSQLHLHIARSTPVLYRDVTVARRDLEQLLATPGMQVKRGRPLRAQGGLYHYVPYAGELLMLGSLAFGLLVVPRAPGLVRGILFVLFLALVAALLATVTRAFLAALLLSCGVMFWLAQRRLRLIALIGVFLVAAAAGFWFHKQRGYGWVAPDDAGTEYREQMWKDSLHIIPHHLLFGVGPDSVMQFGDQWNVVAYKKFPLRSHFHSTYVQLAVDCGLPCLAAWCWLMVAYVVFLGRAWKKSAGGDWFVRGAFLGILGGAIGFVVASSIHYTLGDGEVMMLFWLLMGVAMAVVRLNQNQSV